MTIFKRIIFILGVICFVSGAFWIYSSAKEINFFKNASAQEELKIDLKLKNRGGGWQDSVTKTWAIEGAMPGQMMPLGHFCRWVRLRNTGNLEAERLEIFLDKKNQCEEAGSEESDTKPESAERMDEYIEIVWMRYGGRGPFGWFSGRDLKKELVDENKNGWKDLDDFETYKFEDLDPPCLKKRPSLFLNGDFNFGNFFPNLFCRVKQFSICIRLHPDTPNDYQGDKVTTDISFTLTSEPK